MSGKCGLVLAMLVLCMALLSVLETDAMYVPLTQKLAAIKRDASKVKTNRDKRYTDFQDQASAFCTGLCMFEERKGYSECFDMCNEYYWKQTEMIKRMSDYTTIWGLCKPG